MIPAKRADGAPADTLALASGRNVEEFLGRARKKRSNAAARAGGKTVHPADFVPLAALESAAACGAPAVADDRGADDAQPASEPDEGAVATRDTPARAFAAGNGFSGGDDDWEDVGSEGWEEAQAGSQAAPSASGFEDDGGDVGLTISLRADGARGRGAPPPRKAFTKADREVARLVHRSHLLCLLARGLLYDAAATDAELLAVLLSLSPAPVFHEAAAGAAAGARGAADLAALLRWFRAEFKLATTSVAQQAAVEGEDEIAAAVRRARGVAGVAGQLLACVRRRCGSAEELAALFAAVLRSRGWQARTVRLLEPSSLKPGDALRQQEHAMKAFMKRPARPIPAVVDLTSGREESAPGGASGSTPLLAARAATELLTGEASRRQDQRVARLARQLGVPSEALRPTPGGGVEIDPGKLKRGKAGRAPALRVAEGLTDAPPPPGAAKPKKPCLKAAGPPAEDNGSNTGPGGARAGPSSKGRKRKPGMPAATEPTAAAEPAAEPEPAGPRDPCDSAVPLQAVAEAPAAGRRRRSKGDEEFERELQLAMAATAFSAAAGKQQVAATASGGAEGGAVVAGRGGGARGAAFGAHQPGVGRFWVEAYCGGAADGRWVHVDPVAGWVDRERDVEGLAPRGRAVAYVVAFAGGGAKDVTSRYTSSFLAAEKQREGEWWQGTLRPLRSREVAAMRAAHAAAAAADDDDARPAAGGARGREGRVTSGGGSGGKKRAGALSFRADLSSLREDRELEARAAAERHGLPTTVEGFRTHATFVLARHIGKYQALKPGSKAVGMHRGEAYYLREDLGDVHTADRWRRLGREVEPEELQQPAKQIKKRGAKEAPPPGEEEAEGDDAGCGGGGEGCFSGDSPASPPQMSSFYGVWQTREWEQPAAQGGRVPRNERGNVEVPPFASALPPGTAHVNLPNVGAVCRRLGVDYAPALTGFDFRGGRSVPCVEGVVVCSEHEAGVRAAHEEERRHKEEMARRARAEAAGACWRVLLRSLLTRVRLERSHGGQGAVAEAAAALLHDMHGEPGKRRCPASGRKQRGCASAGGGGEDAEDRTAAKLQTSGGAAECELQECQQPQLDAAGVKIEEI